MKKIIFGLFGIVLAIILVSFLLPSNWRVERSLFIKAAPEQIYPYISNFKTGWPQWSAFDFEDPDIKYSYSGPDEGVGATRSWTSKKMGNGNQNITKAEPHSGIEFDLRMPDHAFSMKGEISLHAVTDGTQVTWIDAGTFGGNPLYHWMGLFMDKMMGVTFEKSLAALKTKVEK